MILIQVVKPTHLLWNKVLFCQKTIQSALECEKTRSKAFGWVFTNFSHRDKLSDSLLDLDMLSVSTRRWIYVIPTQGEPIKIVHAIEKAILDSLPGKTFVYTGQEELRDHLQQFSGSTLSILTDADIPVISTVEAGFVAFLHSCNIKTTSAASLIQRTKGLLTKKGIESHERAAALLYRIVKEAWGFVSEKFNSNEDLFEHDVQSFMLQKFADYSLVTDHAPIIAFGKNTGDPHYDSPKKNSARAKKGDIIQFDLWAKEAFASDENGDISPEAAIFADISWLGVYGTQVPQHYSDAFTHLIAARDTVFATLTKKAKNSATAVFDVTGSELDAGVRKSLIASGYKEWIKHRTGHGIDTSCHGSGANLDSVEFPDHRTLLEGSCFSVEPGIYSDKYGMRTEIDVYIKDGFPVISGSLFAKSDSLPVPQKELLYIKNTDYGIKF